MFKYWYLVLLYLSRRHITIVYCTDKTFQRRSSKSVKYKTTFSLTLNWLQIIISYFKQSNSLVILYQLLTAHFRQWTGHFRQSEKSLNRRLLISRSPIRFPSSQKTQLHHGLQHPSRSSQASLGLHGKQTTCHELKTRLVEGACKFHTKLKTTPDSYSGVQIGKDLFEKQLYLKIVQIHLL